MKKIPFIGSGVALITPFTETGVNYDTLSKLIEFHIENNTDAIIICGTTGEPSTMTEEERKEVIKYTIDKVNKRIPVIAGTGSNSTKAAIEMSKYAESVGADGVLVVTPYYNKTTQNGLIEHYKAIANSINIPIIMYNVPGRTGVNMTAETMYELSKIENIVAIKEASGNISQVAKIAYLCGDNLYIYSGNDDQVVPMLALGAKGVISVLADVEPQDTHNMVIEFMNGNIEASKAIQLRALDLINALFCEVNPIPVKAAVRKLGFDVGGVRLPLIEMSEKNKEILYRAMEEYRK
ncbi:MAG: 4-hydroxy-tetrahydrodipicolinate synthase [Clostridia bacterium]|nr:4-hydroxy-tetrahydrodipicolinate synthase [Clostridia bacterium]